MTFDDWWYINGPDRPHVLQHDEWFEYVKQAWEAGNINAKEEADD